MAERPKQTFPLPSLPAEFNKLVHRNAIYSRQCPRWWKEDLVALSLTCKLLSGMQSISAALLHDFSLYVFEPSLDKLAGFGAHTVLRKHPRRIALMPRQFSPDLLDYDQYARCVSNWWMCLQDPST